MIPAVVLAGGLARRMGGGDKPLRLLAERPLIAHVLACLATQASRVAINANGDPERWSAFQVPILPDPLAGHLGPLAGILAALMWAKSLGAPAVAVVPGDSPLLPANLIERLGESGGPAMAAANGRTHPVIGYWPVPLADDLRAYLEQGGRRVRAWAEQQGATTVTFPGDPFINMNTPEDLLALQAAVASVPP